MDSIKGSLNVELCKIFEETVIAMQVADKKAVCQKLRNFQLRAAAVGEFGLQREAGVMCRELTREIMQQSAAMQEAA